MNYTDRVAKGAAELDRILPGWERQIDLEVLDLGSDCDCVLGQLAVDIAPNTILLDRAPFLAALSEIDPGIDPRWDEICGFNEPAGASMLTEEPDFPSLTEAWKRLIRQRLEAEPMKPSSQA